jgi:hypothetical protein
MRITVIALAAMSGISHASPYYTEAAGFTQNDAAPAGGFSTITIDISGVNSWDLQGDPDNEHIEVQLGGYFHILGIGWDLQISTAGASWLSEPVISANDEFFITPGVGNDFAGSATFSSGGIIDLVAIQQDFLLPGNGLLNFEFFESFDDVSDAIDARFMSGSRMYVEYITFPSPSGMGVLALSGILATHRRRG